MAVKQKSGTVQQKSDAVQQAEQVVEQALNNNQSVHHIIRSITQNPAAVVGTAPGAVTGQEVDETLAIWAAKGYELFQAINAKTYMAGPQHKQPIFDMIYILKKQ